MAAPGLTLYLLPKPRALVLTSSTHALVLRPPPPASRNGTAGGEVGSSRNGAGESRPPQVVVELVALEEVDLSSAPKLARCYGCLGLLELGNDVFVAVITQTSSLGSLYSNEEPISRILAVDFHCLTSSSFDALTSASMSTRGSSSSLNLESMDPLDPHAGGYMMDESMLAQRQALTSQGLYEHPTAGIKKILSNGHFYYSSHFDISSRLQVRVARGDAKGSTASYDGRFLWNSFMIDALLGFRDDLTPDDRIAFDSQNFLVLAIQGFAAVYDNSVHPSIAPGPQSNGPTRLTVGLISRLGWRRAGTRFNTRGVDDDGHVANFVETETIVSATPVSSTSSEQPLIASCVQIRGSVPVFFEQSGTGVQNVLGGLSGQGVKLVITRAGAASLPAFERHFDGVLSEYGGAHILNLLGTKEGESALTSAYSDALRGAGQENEDIRSSVEMTNFDFHHRAKGVAGLEGVRSQLANERAVRRKIEDFGFSLFSVDAKGQKTMVTKQQGVFRTNCLDCLDRTNVVQDMLSRIALEGLLGNILPQAVHSEQLWNVHRSLWADNGDALSKIYAGTGALNTSFTRGGKQTFGGIISNATKSAARMYNSNFLDKNKQASIDTLLGNVANQHAVEVYNPVNEAVRQVMQERRAEYSSTKPASIWVGTFNVNGRTPGPEDLLQWLWPTSGTDPDILVAAFQEMVKLSPQQVMATDPEQRRRWEALLLRSLAQRPNRKEDYIIVRSDQLVGAALIVLIKSSLINDIRNIEATTKKTGLRGMAGNKGAVAIRFDYHDSSFCFLTAHFAAGQSNVEERNHDYRTIVDHLHFLRGKTIDSHENVVWAGDFNYRVGLANEEVRDAIARNDISAALDADQLEASRSAYLVFNGYTEGPITFAPTYKYDNGTDRYDTSEKMRVPSWTDRILYKGEDLDLRRYSRAEIMVSDHRPVYALLHAQVRVVDRARQTAVREEALKSAQRSFVTEDGEDLPPPSDETQSWWQDTDHPSSAVEPSQELLSRVSGRTTNPFDPSFFDDAPESASAQAPLPQKIPPPRPSRPSTALKTPTNEAPPARQNAPPPIPPKPSKA